MSQHDFFLYYKTKSMLRSFVAFETEMQFHSSTFDLVLFTETYQRLVLNILLKVETKCVFELSCFVLMINKTLSES